MYTAWCGTHIHCERIIAIKLINVSIISCSSFFFFFSGLEYLRSTLLSKFQVFNTELLIESHGCTSGLQNLFIMHNWNFVPSDQHFPFLIPLSPHTHHLYPMLLWVWVFYIPHISKIIQYLSFCVWFISLNIVSSRFIHVVAGGRISFYMVYVQYNYTIFPCMKM